MKEFSAKKRFFVFWITLFFVFSCSDKRTPLIDNNEKTASESGWFQSTDSSVQEENVLEKNNEKESILAEKTMETVVEVSPNETTPDQTTARETPNHCSLLKKKRTDELFLTIVGLLLRRYWVHTPKNYNPKESYPVVLNIHGHGSADWQQSLLTSLNKKADEEQFIVVHPQAYTEPASWNAGRCCTPASTLKVDDTRFIKELLKELESNYCVDKKRIYVTGMSNGGMMSYKLACDMANVFAASAPVAGAMVPSPCLPSQKVPIIIFHGTKDPIVLYKGGGLLNFPSTQDSIDFWVKNNACDVTKTTVEVRGDTTCTTYTQCEGNSPVKACITDGGGHTWPGGMPIPTGKTTKDISATDELWNFFKQFTLK